MSSIDVINTGLDVQTIVDQLIQVERTPITRLEKQESALQSKVKALQTYNTKLSKLLDKLNAALFKDETATLSIPSTFAQRLARSVFAARTASSSDESVVTVSAAKGVPAGSYAVTVSSLAQAMIEASSNFADTNSTNTGTGTLTIQIGSKDPVTITVDGTNNTLEGIRDAINNASAGVTATVLNDGSAAPYRLVVTANDTGTANAFTITDNLSGGQALNLAQTQGAVDAQFTVNGISLTKSTNTVTDVISGLTLSLKAISASPVQLTVGKDTDAIVSALKELIDAYNDVNSYANSQFRYDPDTKTAGVLSGDTTLRTTLAKVKSMLTGEVTNSYTDLHYIGEVGLNYNSDGSLSLNEEKLRNAIEINPNGVAALFLGERAEDAADETGTSVLVSLRTMLKSVTDPLSGPIQRATDGFNNTIKILEDRISEYEDRLAVRKEQLTAEYSRADQALKLLTVLQNQLSSQFASLSKVTE